MQIFKTLLLIVAFFSTQLVYGQYYQQKRMNYEWAVGANLRLFNYTLHEYSGRYDDAGVIQKNKFLSTSYGITVERRIIPGLYIGTGLGQSHQIYKVKGFSYGGDPDYKPKEKMFSSRDKIETKSLVVPLSGIYRIPFDYYGNVGVSFTLSLTNSYNLDYYLESLHYYPPRLNIESAPVSDLSITQFTRPYKSTLTFYNDEDFEPDEKIKEQVEFDTGYLFNRYTLGAELGMSIYFNIVGAVRISPGIWYNQDILPATDGAFLPDNKSMYNKSWGVSFEIAYLLGRR